MAEEDRAAGIVPSVQEDPDNGVRNGHVPVPGTETRPPQTRLGRPPTAAYADFRSGSPGLRRFWIRLPSLTISST
jgi:hypothetical protein